MHKLLIALALVAGCAGPDSGGPTPAASGAPPRGIDWKEVRLPEATGAKYTVLGYSYSEKLPGGEGVILRVFDLAYRPLGFVTPEGRALRFTRPGASGEAIDVGTGAPEAAIARIFHAPRPVIIAEWVPPPVELPPPSIR